MAAVTTKAKPIAIDIVIRNFIEEIISLTFLIKDQIDSSSLVTCVPLKQVPRDSWDWSSRHIYRLISINGVVILNRIS